MSAGTIKFDIASEIEVDEFVGSLTTEDELTLCGALLASTINAEDLMEILRDNWDASEISKLRALLSAEEPVSEDKPEAEIEEISDETKEEDDEGA